MRAPLRAPASCDEIGGRSAAIRVVLRKVGRVAATDALVLLGETARPWGLAIRLTDRLRVKGEVRYLITQDVDGGRGAPDMSGTRRSNPANASGGHFDTQLLPIMLEVEWRF